MSNVVIGERGILPDSVISRLCSENEMLNPYTHEKVKDNPSRGLSSYGYDISLGKVFKTYRPIHSLFHTYEPMRPGEVKEEDFDETQLVSMHDSFILNPGEFCLAESVEAFDMPSNVLGLVKDKSSYARMGISVFNTVIEPGWKGILTLEIVNNSNRSVSLAVGRGVAQVIFHGCDPCDTPYGDDDKYQNAEGLEIPK